MPVIETVNGTYLESPTSLPNVECAARPSLNHVLNETWANDPMNPEVCWRLKTVPETDAEKDAKALQMGDVKLAFASELEVLWDNIPALRTAFPDPNGKGKLKQSVVSAIRAKL